MDGSYAELVVVPEVNAYKLNGGVSFADAAAVPTTYLPVWNMAVRRAALQPWETALVFSASAGVGAAAIQVFKNVVGATVIATTSTPEKAELARSLGADHVINYNEEDITQRVREITGGAGVDLLVDHVGADVWAHGFRASAPGGPVLHLRGDQRSAGRAYTWDLLFSRQIEIYGGYMGSREDMRQIVTSLNRGVIKPAIHRTYPLANAADAHGDMEATNFFGKLILQP